MDTQATITIAGAICTALVTAISVLWRVVHSSHKDCQTKHENTQKELLKVTSEVGELKGKIHVATEIGNKLDDFKEEIKKAIQHKNRE